MFCQHIKAEAEVVLSILKNFQLCYNSYCNSRIEVGLGIVVEQCSR